MPFIAGTEESFTRFTSLVYEGREFMNGALLSTESTEFLFQKEAPNSLFFRGVQGIMVLDYYFDWRNSEYYRMDQVPDGRSSLWKNIGDDVVVKTAYGAEEEGRDWGKCFLRNIIENNQGVIPESNQKFGTFYEITITSPARS